MRKNLSQHSMVLWNAQQKALWEGSSSVALCNSSPAASSSPTWCKAVAPCLWHLLLALGLHWHCPNCPVSILQMARLKSPCHRNRNSHQKSHIQTAHCHPVAPGLHVGPPKLHLSHHKFYLPQQKHFMYLKHFPFGEIFWQDSWFLLVWNVLVDNVNATVAVQHRYQNLPPL